MTTFVIRLPGESPHDAAIRSFEEKHGQPAVKVTDHRDVTTGPVPGAEHRPVVRRTISIRVEGSSVCETFTTRGEPV